MHQILCLFIKISRIKLQIKKWLYNTKQKVYNKNKCSVFGGENDV